VTNTWTTTAPDVETWNERVKEVETWSGITRDREPWLPPDFEGVLVVDGTGKFVTDRIGRLVYAHG